MCGIAGWFSWGTARPHPRVVQGLLLANQTRGQDAAGFAYVDPDGNVRIRKAKGPADDFLKTIPATIWERVASSPIGLLHARATSQGSEDRNENNHPVAGLGWCVVHNGHIRNDSDLWTHYQKKDPELKRFAEVDTTALPLVLSRGTDYLGSLENLTLLSGSATAALLNVADPTRLALMRTGHNDLFMSVDPITKILYFTSAGIGARILPNTSLDTLRFLSLTRLPADRVLVLEPGDYKATMYRLEMRPFFPQRSGGGHKTPPATHSSSAPTKTPPATGAADPGVSSDSAHDAGPVSGLTRPRIKWEPIVPDGIKPVPLAFSPATFTWLTYEPETVTNLTADLEPGEQRNLQTPYGRWVFTRSGPQIRRRFKPIKSVKKWLKKHHHSVGLPAMAGGDLSTKLDDVLFLERLIVTGEHTPGTVPLQMLGWVCPWCGAWARHTKWRDRLFRCWLCNVKSKDHERS